MTFHRRSKEISKVETDDEAQGRRSQRGWSVLVTMYKSGEWMPPTLSLGLC